MVFGGDSFYPEGGMYDFIGSFAYLDDAKEEMNRKDSISNSCFFNEWSHIYDLVEGEIIMDRD